MRSASVSGLRSSDAAVSIFSFTDFFTAAACVTSKLSMPMLEACRPRYVASVKSPISTFTHPSPRSELDLAMMALPDGTSCPHLFFFITYTSKNEFDSPLLFT